MTPKQLDGKIDALAYTLCLVIAELENQLMIDGPVLTENLRKSAESGLDGRRLESEMAVQRAESLRRLADALDEARHYREHKHDQ